MDIKIKNVAPGGTFSTIGNSGVFFPYESRQIPEKFSLLCPLTLEENREVYLLTQEDEFLFINCV